MTREERILLETLDEVVRSDKVRAQILAKDEVLGEQLLQLAQKIIERTAQQPP